jgi:tetratricopeptide (TPR) repeat protein
MEVKKMKKTTFLFLITFLLFWSCAKRSQVSSTSEGPTIRGYVFNVEDGNLVPNLKLTLLGSKDTTRIISPTGKYLFKIEPGEYILRIQKEGFETENLTLNLSEPKDYKRDFILMKKKELTPEEQAAQQHFKIGVTAFNEGNFNKARTEFDFANKLNPDDTLTLKYIEKTNNKISDIVNSLFKVALQQEAKKQNKNAIETYKSILGYEPENEKAKERIDEIEKLIASKSKPKTKPKPKPKPTVNVENVYKQGLSLFSQGKYKAAIAKFNTVLKYKPNHSGARSYKKKAQTRLKALGG